MLLANYFSAGILAKYCMRSPQNASRKWAKISSQLHTAGPIPKGVYALQSALDEIKANRAKQAAKQKPGRRPKRTYRAACRCRSALLAQALSTSTASTSSTASTAAKHSIASQVATF